jgi:hypothetical protein
MVREKEGTKKRREEKRREEKRIEEKRCMLAEGPFPVTSGRGQHH